MMRRFLYGTKGAVRRAFTQREHEQWLERCKYNVSWLAESEKCAADPDDSYTDDMLFRLKKKMGYLRNKLIRHLMDPKSN
ncbi:hypothetical protein [Paraburkholderia sp. MM5477-R1]|uniref:hypothetical protein n=1 Tax=Paraburkholderia sp. MM5477-R1 TaxID=2991062 RepID=UPI003D1E0833